MAACYIQVLIGLGAGADEVWMAVQDSYTAGQGARATNKNLGAVSNHLHWLGNLIQAGADGVGSRC